MDKGVKQAQQPTEEQKRTAMVLNQLQMGFNKETIVKNLVEAGTDQAAAQQAVEEIMINVEQVRQKEQFVSSCVVPAAISGDAAALVSGLVWGAIGIVTKYEIGYLAIGVGAAVGYAILFSTKGKKGLPLQAIGIASSILGILIGKYVMFYGLVREYALKEFGREAAASVAIWKPGTAAAFFEALPRMLSGFDALWVVLAVVTVWRILRPTAEAFRPPKRIIEPKA